MKFSIRDDNGNFSELFSWGTGILSFLFFGGLFYFDLNKISAYIFLFFGTIFGGISAYSAQSALLDLRAATNDPHGWRKAKATYKEREMDELDKKSDGDADVSNSTDKETH